MSTAKIVGNRLRRYLGALLAIGFGATWWSLVPPAKAAAVTLRDVAKPKLVVAPVVTPTVEPVEPVEPDEPSIHVSMRLPDPAPKHRPRLIPPATVVTEVVQLDPLPLTAPIAIPVADPIVVPEPEPEFELPRIRTRSS